MNLYEENENKNKISICACLFFVYVFHFLIYVKRIKTKCCCHYEMKDSSGNYLACRSHWYLNNNAIKIRNIKDKACK